MPYLKIDNHNEGCVNPSVKRLYIRDYDNNGKQKFVEYGLTCLNCNIIIKERYQRNPTPRQKRIYDYDKEYTPEQIQQFAGIELKYIFDLMMSNNRTVFNKFKQELIDIGMTELDSHRYIVRILDRRYPTREPDREISPKFKNALDKAFQVS